MTTRRPLTGAVLAAAAVLGFAGCTPREEPRPRPNILWIIAEDLGVITRDVVALRKLFGLPGMQVLQFSWRNG